MIFLFAQIFILGFVGDKYVNGEIIPGNYPVYQPKKRREPKYESRRYERRRDGPPPERRPRQGATQSESTSWWGIQNAIQLLFTRSMVNFNCKYLFPLGSLSKRESKDRFELLQILVMYQRHSNMWSHSWADSCLVWCLAWSRISDIWACYRGLCHLWQTIWPRCAPNLRYNFS